MVVFQGDEDETFRLFHMLRVNDKESLVPLRIICVQDGCGKNTFFFRQSIFVLCPANLCKYLRSYAISGRNVIGLPHLYLYSPLEVGALVIVRQLFVVFSPLYLFVLQLLHVVSYIVFLHNLKRSDESSHRYFFPSISSH